MEIERKVKLLTPENVELEFNLAGIGNRALALLIDYGILFLVL
ncbi:MAG: RDD family protein, partial [Cyanobacteria bacterium KgW148]|nr:RDD family protein [Cyanobacteria bacterium KgW148]